MERERRERREQRQTVFSLRRHFLESQSYFQEFKRLVDFLILSVRKTFFNLLKVLLGLRLKNSVMLLKWGEGSTDVELVTKDVF